jgi:hypothetical protein
MPVDEISLIAKPKIIANADPKTMRELQQYQGDWGPF